MPEVLRVLVAPRTGTSGAPWLVYHYLLCGANNNDRCSIASLGSSQTTYSVTSSTAPALLLVVGYLYTLLFGSVYCVVATDCLANAFMHDSFAALRTDGLTRCSRQIRPRCRSASARGIRSVPKKCSENSRV